MKLGSLFAGIGGFDLAFERHGFETLWQVEKDPSCLKLLSSKFPNAAKWTDVVDFLPDIYEYPNVIVFGSPCQDLSVAGQRRGINGERSGLFFYATRIIQRFVGRGLQFAVWENVPGAFSSNGGRDFAAVLAGLGECGALDIAWRVLDAQWFGLAQRRKRIFLVADFRGERAAEILSLAESLQGHPAPSREKGERVAPTVEGRAGRSGETNFATSGGLIANPVGAHHSRQDLDHDTYVLAHGQANAEIVRDGEPSLTCLHEAPILAHALRSEGADASEDGTGRGTPIVPIAFSCKDNGADAGRDIAPTLRAMNFHKSHAGGGGHAAIAFTERTRAGGRTFECQEDLAYALTNPGSGGRTHNRQIAGAWGVRRLTPLECERLQGFPDAWTEGFSDSCRYRMLGNAVAVPVAEWIAKRIKGSAAA